MATGERRARPRASRRASRWSGTLWCSRRSTPSQPPIRLDASRHDHLRPRDGMHDALARCAQIAPLAITLVALGRGLRLRPRRITPGPEPEHLDAAGSAVDAWLPVR